MVDKISLSIKNPCKQSLDQMPRNAKGRFCNNCEKTVQDFTNFSEKQLLEFFLKEKGQVCGSFRLSQLKTIGTPQSANFLSKGIFFGGLSLLTLIASNKLVAQPPKAPVYIKELLLANHKNSSKEVENKYHINGVVLDKETGEAVPGVNINIEGTEYHTISDIEGNYALHFFNPEENPINLIFRFVGFKTKELVVSIEDKSQEIRNVFLESDMVGLTEEVIIAGGVCTHRKISFRRLWHRVENLFRPKH